MMTLDRCLESLAFCHAQDEHLWASARIVVQQDIDAFMSEQAADLAAGLDALRQLMQAFEERFAGQTDPVLIRSYMRRQIRRIEFDIKREADRAKELNDATQFSDAPATVPEGHLEAGDPSVPHDAPDTVGAPAAHPSEPGGSPAIQAPDVPIPETGSTGEDASARTL